MGRGYVLDQQQRLLRNLTFRQQQPTPLRDGSAEPHVNWLLHNLLEDPAHTRAGQAAGRPLSCQRHRAVAASGGGLSRRHGPGPHSPGDCLSVDSDLTAPV